MATIFTEQMLSEHNFGLIVIKDDALTQNINTVRSATYAAAVTYKLIWTAQGDKKYGFCNFLTDGWVYLLEDLNEVVAFLNIGGFRILTRDELQLILLLRSNINQLLIK